MTQGAEKSTHRVARSEQEQDLLRSCHDGDTISVSALLDLGTSALIVDSEGISPALTAASGGQTDVLAALLQREANSVASFTSAAGNFPLRAACLLGDAECICQLLDSGAEVDKETARGTALSTAAAQGDADTMQLLIARGADVHKRLLTGSTCLHVAVRGGHAPCVRALLAHGADPTLTDRDGESSLDLAERLALPDVLAQLVRAAVAQTIDATFAEAQAREEAAAQDAAEDLASSGSRQQSVQKPVHSERHDRMIALRLEAEDLRKRFAGCSAFAHTRGGCKLPAIAGTRGSS